MHANPILWADYPDLDVIRIEDTWYMVSTTMHMMPGCVILRSYDLMHWETLTHVYDTLDGTPAQRLDGLSHIYGQGMWAATLRHHNNKCYLVFVANDTHKTYLFTADEMAGPWEKREIEGFYHDCSLLFEEDRPFLAYGNTDIRLVELKPDLSGPLPGGVDRVIVTETEPFHLGYEGAHFYKINGRYHLFLIHISQSGHQRRTQAWFSSDSLEGPYTGGDILDDDMGYFNAGVAQGGIVDTPDGEWFSILFQDHGAVGRIPVLVPMVWRDGKPVLGDNGRVPRFVSALSTRPEHRYKPLVASDDFMYAPDADGTVRLKDVWQWNHQPDPALWSVTDPPGFLRIRTDKRSPNVHHAANTLTQRTFGPQSGAVVTVDGSRLNPGDQAGLCLLIGTYGLIALRKEPEGYVLVMEAKASRDESIFENLTDGVPGEVLARIPTASATVTLRAQCDFRDNRDEVRFSWLRGEEWVPLGPAHRMHYKLDQFMGARFGLFMQSTETVGGEARFSRFIYEGPEAFECACSQAIG